jgi:dTDP-4-amino-4,6-dideoxygalactose transaminase
VHGRTASGHIGRSRDLVLDALNVENIGTGVHYISVYLHPLYQKVLWQGREDFPNVEWIGARTLTLQQSKALAKKTSMKLSGFFKKL